MLLPSALFLALGVYIAGTNAQGASDTSAIYQLSSDPEFAFLFEEYLALSNNFGANTGEVLRAASQIKPGDFESWYSEFKFLADAIHTKAAAIDSKRFPVSAREAYFRSSSYYRAADFFLHSNWSDPRINTLWDLALADFDAAIKLLPIPAEQASLKATNFSVPVIFFPASPEVARGAAGVRKQNCTTKPKLPTVIVGTGYDGSQQAVYHYMGRSIVDRGWNFISYEGPGQPTVRRQQDIGFIENWWDVITPIVDYLHTRDDVDPERIALVGMSFGGTLAPRAASREHRLSAVLAINGLMNMAEAIFKQVGDPLASLFASGDAATFDAVMLNLMNNATIPTQFRWLIGQGLWSFNTTSPFEWLTELGTIVADAPVLANVTCPVFVAEGQDDSSAPGQPVEMAHDLGNLSTYNLFKTELGAGEHCQLGAEAQLNQVSLDWLADIWDGIKVPSNLTDGVY
ncbi:alpha/beta-hydrolase [Thozetella sp. PMI_491]|nr:alpha/beta-hydrolase [Thozetella sp. PMI_491]